MNLLLIATSISALITMMAATTMVVDAQSSSSSPSSSYRTPMYKQWGIDKLEPTSQDWVMMAVDSTSESTIESGACYRWPAYSSYFFYFRFYQYSPSYTSAQYWSLFLYRCSSSSTTGCGSCSRDSSTPIRVGTQRYISRWKRYVNWSSFETYRIPERMEVRTFGSSSRCGSTSTSDLENIMNYPASYKKYCFPDPWSAPSTTSSKSRVGLALPIAKSSYQVECTDAGGAVFREYSNAECSGTAANYVVADASSTTSAPTRNCVGTRQLFCHGNKSKTTRTDASTNRHYAIRLSTSKYYRSSPSTSSSSAGATGSFATILSLLIALIFASL